MIHIAIMLFCNKTEGYFYIFPYTRQFIDVAALYFLAVLW